MRPMRPGCSVLKVCMRSACVLAFAAALLGVAAPVSLGGCFGHQCDPSYVTLANDFGRLIDANTWESSSMDGDWLDYAPQRVTAVPLTMLGNRLPTSVLVYVSGARRPVGSPVQSSFALATGSLATISSLSVMNVQIHNDTCAQYYARFVVTVAPQSWGQDGGAPTDAALVLDASDASDAR